MLEADLLEQYGVDIYDWFRGEMSTRRLLNLVFQLRQESGFVAKTTGSERLSFADERLMDIPEALTGKSHPIRQAIARAEKNQAMAPKRAAALKKARARRAAQR